MSRSDTARRGISLVLAVLCLLVVPGLASAAFTNREPAVAEMKVGAATLAAPTGVDGTYRCSAGFILLVPESIDVTTTKVNHGNRAGLPYTYSYELLRAGRVVDSASSTSPTESKLLEGQLFKDFEATTWTLRVNIGYRNWTTLVPFEKDITCPANGSVSGTL